MNPFEMVIGIVLIVTIGRVLQSRFRSMNRQAPIDSADTMRMRDEVHQLKERIAVLERVVTDNHGSIDLDREIERLRDR